MNCPECQDKINTAVDYGLINFIGDDVSDRMPKETPFSCLKCGHCWWIKNTEIVWPKLGKKVNNVDDYPF